MYKRILVTLDGSASSEAVIPHAVGVATMTRSEITLLRVVDPNGPDWGERGSIGRAPSGAVSNSLPVEQAQAYLDKIAAQLHRSEIAVHIEIRQGQPAKQIVAAARELEADVIAMATHSRRGINRLMFGSVAEAVLHESSLPVLLVRS